MINMRSGRGKDCPYKHDLPGTRCSLQYPHLSRTKAAAAGAWPQPGLPCLLAVPITIIFATRHVTLITAAHGDIRPYFTGNHCHRGLEVEHAHSVYKEPMHSSKAFLRNHRCGAPCPCHRGVLAMVAITMNIVLDDCDDFVACDISVRCLPLHVNVMVGPHLKGEKVKAISASISPNGDSWPLLWTKVIRV
ncbi:hypothetical protein BC834DRAFT_331221 [Gloeopeniophorella convolvens]|nr:hypothetical protein BC834DRAFT_331221 [Gloeopeniophorella convolvens]